MSTAYICLLLPAQLSYTPLASFICCQTHRPCPHIHISHPLLHLYTRTYINNKHPLIIPHTYAPTCIHTCYMLPMYILTQTSTPTLHAPRLPIHPLACPFHMHSLEYTSASNTHTYICSPAHMLAHAPPYMHITCTYTCPCTCYIYVCSHVYSQLHAYLHLLALSLLSCIALYRHLATSIIIHTDEIFQGGGDGYIPQ